MHRYVPLHHIVRKGHVHSIPKPDKNIREKVVIEMKQAQPHVRQEETVHSLSITQLDKTQARIGTA